VLALAQLDYVRQYPELLALGVLATVLMGAGLFLVWDQWTAARVSAEARTILKGLSRGEYALSPRHTRLSGWLDLADAFSEVQRELQQRFEEVADQTARLAGAENALNALPSAVCVADPDGTIVYLNRALENILRRDEKSFAAQIPGFRSEDTLGRSVSMFRLDEGQPTSAPGAANDDCGSQRRRLGGRYYDVIEVPLRAADGTVLGSICQWVDVDEQVQVEREVNSVIGAARVGNFRGRIDVTAKRGDHRKMGESVNLLLTASEARLEDVGRVMGALAQGDLTQRIRTDYESGALDLTRQFRDYFPGGFTVTSERCDVQGVATPEMRSGDLSINGHFDVVDRFTQVTGSVATLFVRDQDDFVRISTSLTDEKGNRPLGTKLDRSHAAYKLALQGRNYVGPAKLFGHDYMASYEPISSGANVVGILFIGFDMDPRQNLFAKLGEDVSETVARLTEMITQIRSAGESIYSSAREISAGNNDLSARTERQAESLEETATSMVELTSIVRQSAESAQQANALAMGAADVALRGGEAVSQVVETMSSIHSSSQQVVEIISVIDSIAFQTNILALNAAVEAARAGEQGRGFAVVAGEVRALAQRSAIAAKEIRSLIGASVDQVSAGSKLADKAGSTMNEIVQAVKRVTHIMAELASASGQQSGGIEKINEAIGAMDQVTHQNAALVEQAASGARSLEEQAQTLSEVMSRFRLETADADCDTQNAMPRLSAPAIQAPKQSVRLRA
jgi:methyl-accepting chemotaxis protein